jgi:hypothetical protein
MELQKQINREPLEVFINRLPTKILRDFTKKHKKRYNLRTHLPREKLISQILQKVPEEVILQDLYAPYGWAGDVTIHLFQIDGSKLNEISKESQLANLLKSLDFKRGLTELPEPVNMTLSDDEIRIRHEFLGEPIIYRDPSTYKLQTVRPLETAFSVIHLPTGFTELRVRKRTYALNAVKLLTHYFGGNYKILSFTRDNLAEWIDWATTLRNARFKPTGPISTLYMGAKGCLELRNVGVFKEWWKKGERVEGIYIKFEYSSKRELGFSINARMGKIMFRTFASEEEIKLVVNRGRLILGL